MNRPSIRTAIIPTTTSSSKRLGVVALAALTLGAVVAVPSTVSAAAPAPAAAPADLGPRLERACLRIPNIEIRTAELIERLQGDATVRGSLSWLQAQIDKAVARNRAELVTVLQNRLAVREQTLEVLLQRQAELPRLKQLCIDNGVPL